MQTELKIMSEYPSMGDLLVLMVQNGETKGTTTAFLATDGDDNDYLFFVSGEMDKIIEMSGGLAGDHIRIETEWNVYRLIKIIPNDDLLLKEV